MPKVESSGGPRSILTMIDMWVVSDRSLVVIAADYCDGCCLDV